MAAREDRGGIAGISTGGIIVIVGILIMIFWSFLVGLIVTLVGLIAFGGFRTGQVVLTARAGRSSHPQRRCGIVSPGRT